MATSKQALKDSAKYHETLTFALAAGMPQCNVHFLESGTRIQLATCAPFWRKQTSPPSAVAGSPIVELKAEIWPAFRLTERQPTKDQ
jgi:hypothetical protein